MKTIGFALIGCGGITLQNHLPGIAMCEGAKAVALCDANPKILDQAVRQTGITVSSTRYEDIIAREDVQAVIIATPNVFHGPIAQAAIRAGKHVMCEKPLAMTAAEARAMAEEADHAHLRHMTAFTYRFVPAMRYLAHLIQDGALGTPYHFRSCRLQDWGDRDLGWRQESKLAGSGELGDMLSHRLDFSYLLMGRIQRLTAQVKRFIDIRQGHPSDLEDWAAVLAEFESGATGVMESSKLATGHNESWRSQDYVEVNGSERSFVFLTGRWNELKVGKPGGLGLETITIPKEFWTWPGSPRDASKGDPLITFRYDQAFEFIQAIHNERPCRPSFHDGARAQTIMEAALEAGREGTWVEPLA